MVYGRSIAIGGGLLTLVILLSALMFYLSMGPCPQGTFACDNGQLCVPQRQICDNRLNCLDKTDEDPVECGLLYGSKEMTNKIVGHAIAKQKQLEQMNNNSNNTSQSTVQGGEMDVDVAESEEGVATGIDRENVVYGEATAGVSSINNSNNLSSIQQNLAATIIPATTTIIRKRNCIISTYPKKCTCIKNTLLHCGVQAQLQSISQISAEVTSLLIIGKSFTPHEGSFAALKNLQRLVLKYNNISLLPAGVFVGLPRLERLDVRHNNLSMLPRGVFHDLRALLWLFLISNQMRHFPAAHLSDMPQLEWLKLSHNFLTLRNDKFPRMLQLYEIYLDFNRMEYVGAQTFAQLDNLHLLDLGWNNITHIHPHAFWGLKNLRDIRLTGNPIKQLNGEAFWQSSHLEALSLAYTPLHIATGLLRSLNVSYMNLTGILFEHIDFASVGAMHSLKYIIYDRFYFCSMTPHVRLCKPNSDGVSSFQDLLSKPALRYSAWIMGVITLVGNVMVLWGRFMYRDENVAVTMVIRNLALADILMGFYLLAIGAQDYRYRNQYHKVSLDWITSWQCAAVGVLAVTSSEVSMFILAFMSLERFLLIADPFRCHLRIGLRNIFIALLCIWLLGVGIAVAPVILWRSSNKFYGTYSGTCFPLHIQEPYPLGWQYSAFMFLGVNSLLLIMIALLYTALLISIWRTRKATPLSLLDCEFAVRFFFIVLTDVLCWAPIIAGKIWVFFNYNISDDIYGWLVVFILPLNSAVNPLLYTFTTPKYRNQILLRGWKKITARKRAEPSNGMATTTIGTATASSNPDETSCKAIPLTTTK